MKALLLAGAAALTLGIGVASEQGLPASTFPQTYGSTWPGDVSDKMSQGRPGLSPAHRKTNQAPALRTDKQNVPAPASVAGG